MEGKGMIKWLLILVAIVCAIQLFYFIPTGDVESSAEEAGLVAGDFNSTDYKIAKSRYLDSMSNETVLSIPFLKDYSYSELKRQQLALGLDLKGGMSTVLEVDLSEFLRVLAGNNKNEPAFKQALKDAKTAQKNSQSDYITLFADAYVSQSGENPSLTKIFRRATVLGDFNSETSDGEIIKALREKANETVSLTFNRLKERVDRLGVAQPNLSLDAGRDLILVELPGIDNPERAKEYLQASAALEFWEIYQTNDQGILAAFQEADRRLKAAAGDTGATVAIEMDTTYTNQYDGDGNETGVVDTTFTPKVGSELLANQGPLLSKLSLNNGTYYPTVMGIADRTAKNDIMKILRKEEIRALFPKDSRFAWSYKPHENADKETTKQYELSLLKTVPGSDKAPLEGDVVVKASSDTDPTTGEIGVALSMNPKGAKKWGEMTTKASQQGNRSIAIVLDSMVVSAPTVRNPITGGNSSITGSYTIDEAVQFANVLEVGKLPAKLDILQSNTVGPSLGAKNISRSVYSLLIGFGLLLLFMVLYYAGGGLIAIGALLLNLFFIFGCLSSFGTVLTLAGIAGVVLTIGMAVDASVIIYERIKEELRAGKSNLAAIQDGFSNSYSAIIDANVTTILVAGVLAYFGLGPIKGFAIVLIIGVICSLFTAVLVGKMIIDWYTKDKGNELSFWTGFSKDKFANLQIDWMGKRKIAYVISGVFIVAGLASIFTRGFDLGVDFKGGYAYNVQFAEGSNVDTEAIKQGLTEILGSTPEVKAVDSDNTLRILTSYLIEENGEDTDVKVMDKINEGLNNVTGASTTLIEFMNSSSGDDVTHITQSNKVQPTIADDIKQSSKYAGVIALILIFLYIFLRFNKWQYSLGAVAALLHDALVVLGIFSLCKGVLPFALSVDQNFVAAILTVIGYSINDTVVVFDRIREYMGIYTNKPKNEVINMAVNSTFSRTLITSFTTLLVVLILFIFGGSAIKGFAFALIVGIVVGTYSSVFVATPIVSDLADNLRTNRRANSGSSNKGGKSFGRSAKAAFDSSAS